MVMPRWTRIGRHIRREESADQRERGDGLSDFGDIRRDIEGICDLFSADDAPAHSVTSAHDPYRSSKE